jgi:hypothetical protein
VSDAAREWNSRQVRRKVNWQGKTARKEAEMKNLGKLAGVLAITGLCSTLLILPQFAATQTQQPVSGMDHSAANPSEPVPAFHAQPPAGELPPTMEASIYSDKLVFNAYVVAGRIRKVLYQEPCYCHCDRSNGHASWTVSWGAMAPVVTSARKKSSTPTSKAVTARLPRRYAQESSTANGKT